MLPYRYAILALLCYNYFNAIEVQEAKLVSTPGGYDLKLKVILSDVRTTGSTPTYGTTISQAQLDDGTVVTLNKPVEVDVAGSSVPYVDISWTFGDPVDDIQQHEVQNCGTDCPIPTSTSGYEQLHWQSVSPTRVNEILDNVKCASMQTCKMLYTENHALPWLSLGGVGGYKMIPNDISDLSWAFRQNPSSYLSDWSQGWTKDGIVRKYVPGEPDACPSECDLSAVSSYKSACGSNPHCPCMSNCLYKGCTENGIDWAGGMCNTHYANRGAIQGGSHEIEDDNATFIGNKYKNWFIGLQDRQLTYKGMLVWGSTTPYSYMQYQKWRVVWDTTSAAGIQNRLLCDSTTPKGQGLTGTTAWYWRSNWDSTKGLCDCTNGGDNGVHWKNNKEYRKISYVFESEETHLNDLLATYKVDGIENAGVSVSDNKAAVLAELQTKRLVMDDPGLTGAYPSSTTWRFFNETAFHYGCHGVMVDALAWAHQGFDRLVHDDTAPSATFAASNNGQTQPYCSRPRDYCMENVFSTWDDAAHGYKSIPGAETYTDTKAEADFGYAPDSIPTPQYETSNAIDKGVRTYKHDAIKTRITLGMPVWLTLSNIVRAEGPKITVSSSSVVIPENDYTFKAEVTIQNTASQYTFHLETTCIQNDDIVSGEAQTVAANAVQNLILNIPATCILGADWLSDDHAFRVTTGVEYGNVYDTNLPFTISITAPITNTCTCPNGVAAVSTACTAQGAHICTSCTTVGYHLASSTCTANVCTCSNGEAATGASCTFHESALCSSCNLGWHLTNNACIANTCTCSNGTPATGENCTTNQAAICSSCSTGYDHINNTCVAKPCTCANGTVATADACTTPGAEICSSCNDGWHLNSSTSSCLANTCTCEGGIPASGAECVNHGMGKCSVCPEGYADVNGVCTIQPCSCDNGTPIPANECSTSGANICASCNVGFTLHSGACQANTCSCIHGTSATGAMCTTDGALICSSCNSNYKLTSNQCEANICSCPDGTVTSHCSIDGAVSCASCDSLYHLHNETCTHAEIHGDFEFLGSGTCTTDNGPPKAFIKASVTEEHCKATASQHNMIGFSHSWDDLCILYPGTVAFQDTSYSGPTDVANTGSISGIIAGPSVKCYRARIVAVLEPHTWLEPNNSNWQDACVFLSSVQVLRVEGNFIFHNKVCHERLQGTYIVDTSTCIKYLVAYDSDGPTAGAHKSSKTGLYECDQTTGERIGLPNEGSLALMIDHEIMFTARWAEVMAFCGQISDEILTDTVTVRLLLDYDSFAAGTASGSDIQEELVKQLAAAGEVKPEHISIDSWTKGSIIGVLTITGDREQPASDSKQRMQNLISGSADNHVHEEKHGANETNGASILDWIDPWYIDNNEQSVVFTHCPVNIRAVVPHGEARVNVEWESPKAFFHKSRIETPQPAVVTQIYGGQSGAPFQAGGHFIRYIASSTDSSLHAIPCTFVVTVTREETSKAAQAEAVIAETKKEEKKKGFMEGQIARLIAGIIFFTICGFGCCYWYGRNPRGSAGIVQDMTSILSRSGSSQEGRSRYASLRIIKENNTESWVNEDSSDSSCKKHEKISLISMAKGIHQQDLSEEDMVADIEMSSPRSIRPTPPSHPNTSRLRLSTKREVVDDEPDLRSVEVFERESLFD